jgi:hypothetical protein
MAETLNKAQNRLDRLFGASIDGKLSSIEHDIVLVLAFVVQHLATTMDHHDPENDVDPDGREADAADWNAARTRQDTERVRAGIGHAFEHMQSAYGTPTSQDLNYLVDTTDAALWAEEFIRLHSGKFIKPNGQVGEIGEGLMITWFANAIETGRRHPTPDGQANLGLATTMELMQEVMTRIAIDYNNGGGGLNFSTVRGRPKDAL